MQLSFSEVAATGPSRMRSPEHPGDQALPFVADGRLRMHVLASGSKGNATIIEDEASGRAVLIDCGICKRDFFDRCSEVGIGARSIEAILVTHEHTDHTKGLGVVMRGLAKQGLSPRIYASNRVLNASSELISIQDACEIRLFSDEEALSLGGMTVHAFATSHDAEESFGFRVEHAQGDVLGYLTDSGVVTPQAFDALSGCRILALESNHDVRMLETGPYPYMLKKRVASDKGHLSNIQAAEALDALLETGLEQVVAMHISENNNTYRLPQEVLAEVLTRNGHPAKVCAAFQQRPVSV